MLRCMTTLKIGPSHGSLTLHTGVEGRAARAGHALTLALPDWSAVITVEGTEPTAVSMRVPWATLQVVRGEGVLPLTPLDKGVIKSSALKALSADTHPELVFTSTSVTPQAGGYEVRGQASLAGATGPLGVVVHVNRTDGVIACEATFPFVQSDFGLKPYSAMLRSLRVSDAVEVRMSVAFPDPAA